MLPVHFHYATYAFFNVYLLHTKKLKVIELFNEHKALIKVLPIHKPQTLSCKIFISEEVTSNKNTSRTAFAVKKISVGQAFYHIYI